MNVLNSVQKKQWQGNQTGVVDEQRKTLFIFILFLDVLSLYEVLGRQENEGESCRPNLSATAAPRDAQKFAMTSLVGRVQHEAAAGDAPLFPGSGDASGF